MYVLVPYQIEYTVTVVLSLMAYIKFINCWCGIVLPCH